MPSTYIYLFRLTPRDVCRNLHLNGIALHNDMLLDIIYDGMALEVLEVAVPFGDLRARAYATAENLLYAQTFFSGKVIWYTPTHWVETQGTVSETNVVGFIDSNFGNWKPKPTHKDNRAFKDAVDLLPVIDNNSFLRWGLRDYYSAVREPGEDMYFFAYRAIEVVKSAFGKMHATLGTSKTRIMTIVDMATHSRHGNFMKVATKPEKKKSTLRVTRDVLDRYIKHLKTSGP